MSLETEVGPGSCIENVWMPANCSLQPWNVGLKRPAQIFSRGAFCFLARLLETSGRSTSVSEGCSLAWFDVDEDIHAGLSSIGWPGV
jgi:hypothetical protein